jgi:peptidoglycan/LPS O-acetylase OafA/YrhL
MPTDRKIVAKTTYRPDIDGLRATSASSIVIAHAMGSPIHAAAGVDIFFVISGYLISGIIIDGYRSNKFSFLKFYFRRARRIIPALLVVLLAVLVFGWFVLFPDELDQLARHTVGGLFFSANIMFWQEAGYFDTSGELKLLLHLWSLSVEEQFYMIWPSLLILAMRFRVNVMLFLTTCFAVSFLANVAFINSHPVATFFLAPFRFWELLIGAVLANISTDYASRVDGAIEKVVFSWLALPRSYVSLDNLKSITGAVLLIVSFILLDANKSYPGWWACGPTFGTAFLIWAGPNAWINKKILSSAPFVFVGLLSYPLYLWHWPLIVYARIIEGTHTPSIGSLVFVVVAAYVLSTLTWLFIEKPIRSWALPFSGIAAAVGTAAIALVAIVGSHDGGYTKRLVLEQSVNISWPVSLQHSKECLKLFPNVSNLDYCLIDNPTKPPDVALIGDSNANYYYPGLSAYYEKRGHNLINLGRGTCPPLRDFEIRTPDNFACAPVMNHTLDYVINNPSIKTILLGASWPREARGGPTCCTPAQKPFHGRFLMSDPDLHDPERIFHLALMKTVSELIKTGKQIIFLDTMPRLPFDIRECIYARPFGKSSMASKRNIIDACGIARARHDENVAPFRSALRDVENQFPQMLVFEPDKYVCSDIFCDARADGKIIYRDGGHLSLSGSKWLVGRFEREFSK